MSTDSRQQKVRDALAHLNITGRESNVFFALLERGASTAAALARNLRTIPRTSVYDILKSLQHQGLVSSVTKNDEVLYQVENVEHTVDVIEAQKRELTDKQNAIRSVADMLVQFKSGTVYTPGTRFFEEKGGILAIHRELQNAHAETRTIVDIASV